MTRHVEDPGLTALVVLGTQGEQPVQRHAGGQRVAAEVGVDLVGTEAVDAAGTGDVVVNTVEARTASSGLVEGEPLVPTSSLDPLDAEEAGVPLVGVETSGLGAPVSRDQARTAPGPHRRQATSCSIPAVAATAVERLGDIAVASSFSGDIESRRAAGTPADQRAFQMCA